MSVTSVNEDIFADWKKHHYKIAESDLHDLGPGITLIILTDTTYWLNHFDDLFAWCKDNDARVEGLSVVITNPEQLTHFVLRWG